MSNITSKYRSSLNIEQKNAFIQTVDKHMYNFEKKKCLLPLNYNFFFTIFWSILIGNVLQILRENMKKKNKTKQNKTHHRVKILWSLLFYI